MEDKNKIHLYKAEASSMEEILRQKVQEKLVNEYNALIEELKKERPEVIIERAYEIVCKKEIAYGFDNVYLDIKQCKALLNCKDILSVSYSEWMKDDSNFDENFEYSISEAIEHITKNYDKDQKTKNKDAR